VYRWTGGIAVALLLLGVGVGCGGGGGDTTSEITKAQFVKKANAICADYSSKRSAAAEKKYNEPVNGAGDKASEAEFRKLGEEVLEESIIPILNEQQEKLESLGAPAGDEEAVEAMMGHMGQAIGEIEDEGFEGVLGGNQFDPFEEEAEKYGLKCRVV